MPACSAKLQLLEGADPARKRQEVIRFEVIAEQWHQANGVCWADSTAKKVRTYLGKDICPLSLSAFQNFHEHTHHALLP